ncbi:ChaN family lipoprotein [Patescibacteria group bacterium]|nr:ChaN family lipoprotein [Patescibacteria group bacterium]MBU4580347.1 ChaN family lipoprotein [Patescibacteria group bacterium]
MIIEQVKENMPQEKMENFKFPPENNAGDLNEQEIEQAKLYIAKRKNNESVENRPFVAEDIRQLSSKYLSGEKRIKDFGDFLAVKTDPKNKYSRRNFLKIAGAAIGVATGIMTYKYLKENFDALWAEFQETTENNYETVYSKEMTNLYKELEKFPEEKIDYEKVNKNLNGINIEFKHAEFIKNSDKKEVDEMIDSMIASKNDIILFGEYHGVDSNAVDAVQVLEKLMKKTDKKISKIGLEFLDFKDPVSVDLIEKFNNKQISSEDFYSQGYFQSDIRPLLEFAQKNNIPVEGLENKNNLSDDLSLEEKAAKRAVDMNLKAGSMAQEKDSNDILIIFSGVAHSSKSGYGEKKGRNYLPPVQTVEYTTQGTADEAVEKNYLFKESLEKQKFKPAVIKLENMNHQARANNNLFGYTYNFLKDEDAQKFSEQWKQEWQNYKIDRKKPFSINSNDEKNSFLLVNPSEIPNTPPALNVFEEIRKKFNPLYKMIRKKDYVSYSPPPNKYEMSLLAQTGASLSAKLADINLKSGNPEKMYLPEQIK